MAVEEETEEMAQSGLFFTTGATDLGLSLLLFVSTNALAYGIAKAFNLQYGRLLAGTLILLLALLLDASTNLSLRFVFLLGIGEIIIGALDFLAQKVGTPLAYIFDPMYGVQ